MSLSEETLSAKSNLQMPFTSCASAIKSQQVLRDELDIATKKFLENGGKIRYLTPSANKILEPEENIDLSWASKDKESKRKRAHATVSSKLFVNSPIAFHDGKNRSNGFSSSGHQNISSKLRKSGMRYSVIIGKTTYGTYDNIKDALAKRDVQREILGMEKAIY